MPLAAPNGAEELKSAYFASYKLYNCPVGRDILIDPKIRDHEPVLHISVMNNKSDELTFFGRNRF